MLVVDHGGLADLVGDVADLVEVVPHQPVDVAGAGLLVGEVQALGVVGEVEVHGDVQLLARCGAMNARIL